MPVVRPKLMFDGVSRPASGWFTSSSEFRYKWLHRWHQQTDAQPSVYAVRGDDRRPDSQGHTGWVVLGVAPEEAARWIAGDRWSIGLRCVLSGNDPSMIGSLWIPCESTLYPMPPTAVLRKAAGGNWVRVWLPDRGLIGWEADDMIKPADLVSVPPRDTQRWSSPSVPVALADRISSMTLMVEPEDSGGGQSVVDSIRQELGLSETPRPLIDPNEGPPSRRLGRWLRQQIRRRDASTAGDASVDDANGDSGDVNGGSDAASTSAMSSMFDRVASSMTAGLYSMLSRGLQKDRDEAIEKLMRMFRDDPDRALQHALPMGGGGAFRGLSRPGSSLMRRDVDFSLSGYNSGGSAADFWDLNPHHQIRLRQTYQRRAEEEFAAGRYRRAAYIYAQLIGDVRSAAEALRKGGYCHEAAVLYRDRLKQPQQAAECFAEGRMFDEAVTMFTDLRMHRRAAEVCRLAGDEVSARNHLDAEAESLMQRGQIAAAAAIIGEELGRVDEAKALLADQYPMGRDVVASMRRLGAWIERDEGADAAVRWIREIADPTRSTLFAQTATIMADAVCSPADPKIRIAAADECRLAAARTVHQGEPTDVGSVMADLRRIAGGDDQWRRDIDRFKLQSRTSRSTVPDKPGVLPWRVQTKFDLAGESVFAIHSIDRWLVWLAFASGAGTEPELRLGVCAVDHPGDAIHQCLSTRDKDWSQESAWVEAMRIQDGTLNLNVVGGFNGHDSPIVASGAGLTIHVTLIARGDQTPIADPRTWSSSSLVSTGGEVVLGNGIVLWPPDGLMDVQAPYPTTETSAASPLWVDVRGEIFVCVAGHLWSSRNGGELMVETPVYGGNERTIAVSPRFTPPRLAIATDTGVSVISLRSGEVQRLADDEDCEDVTWINRRDIAILSNRRVMIYRRELDGYQRITTLATYLRSPSSVLSLGRGRFALADMTGPCQIEVYEPAGKLKK